jgi:ribose/xylose/arabinose/galactoside ABC-type transport system permease subunit
MTTLPEEQPRAGFSRSSARASLARRLLAYGGTQFGALLVINVLFAIFMTLSTPVFLTSENLLAVGVAMTGNVLAAMGSTLVLLTGGFDLSVGSSYGLAGVITALALVHGTSVPGSMLLGLLVGMFIGLINGLIVTKLEINAFIATMGTMTIGRGIINILTRGYSVAGLPDSFARLVYAKLFGLPPSFFVMILAVVVTDLLLRFWRPARQLYYIGGSPAYARLIGIRTDRVRIMAYVLSGTFAALGGLLFTMRTAAGSQQAGTGLEMMALVAPLLGGVGFGGEGSAVGAFLGAALIALVVNAIQLLSIAVLWQDVVIGTFLIVAALIGMTRLRQASASGAPKSRRKEGSIEQSNALSTRSDSQLDLRSKQEEASK